MTTYHGRYRDEDAIGRATWTRRRLFIFCDGTWQDGVNSGHAPTNVATLARCLKPVADDGYLQISYYDSGVGAVTSKPAQLIDGATGRGISSKIRNAYSFLSHNYNFAAPSEYTEIYLVGFSRGAFAVQCLASFISRTGLLKSLQLYYLRGLFSLWSCQEFKPRLRGSSGRGPVAAELDRAIEDLGTLLRQVSIKALVVYDTVSALGLPNPFATRPLSFVGKHVPKIVEHAFQALALDERRRAFKPVVWESVEGSGSDAPAVMKQCWFLGSHSDIGGNGDAALGAVTLLWVIGQLRAHTGVSFEDYQVFRHLKHRLLEWEIRIQKTLGTFKEEATLSTISNSGQITDAEMYWWFFGLKSRRSLLEGALRNPTDSMTIHFTVRLAMAAKRNQCRLLETPATRLFQVVVDGDPQPDEDTATGDGDRATAAESLLVRWCLPEMQTGAPEDAVSDNEMELLVAWTNIGTANDPLKLLGPTDKKAFVERRRHLNETDAKGEDIYDRNRASFALFLRENMRFTDTGPPSADRMCPPPR